MIRTFDLLVKLTVDDSARDLNRVAPIFPEIMEALTPDSGAKVRLRNGGFLTVQIHELHETTKYTKA